MKNTRERKYAERWEHFKASVRAKVEHPFRVVKRQFGYTKVRYWTDQPFVDIRTP